MATRAGLRTGAIRLVARELLLVEHTADAATIESVVAEIFGRPVRLAFHLGHPRANRKPVAQALDCNGSLLGIVKIGTTELAAALVRAEARTLETIPRDSMRLTQAPELVAQTEFQGMPVVVQTVLPTWKAAAPTDAQWSAAALEIANLVNYGSLDLLSGPFGQSLRDRAESLMDPRAADTISSILDRLKEYGSPAVDHGMWHGDWTEWNAAAHDRRVLVWDWERYSGPVPGGFDELHRTFQQLLAARAQPRAAATQRLFARADVLLAPFGVPRAATAAVTATYLLTIATRYLSDGQARSGGSLGDVAQWLLPEIRREVEHQ